MNEQIAQFLMFLNEREAGQERGYAWLLERLEHGGTTDIPEKELVYRLNKNVAGMEMLKSIRIHFREIFSEIIKLNS